MIKKVKDGAEKIIEKLLAIQPVPKHTDYYMEAKNWYSEVYESMICSRDRYRLLAILLGFLLAMSVTAMVMMMPLKSYFYRILAVNQQTGEITQLKELEQREFTATWAVTRYFINQYIQYRNSYSYEDIQRTFNMSLAMSDKIIADEYSASIVDSNPKSPIKVLGKDSFREVTVFSINQLNSNTALVRFKILTHNKSNSNEVKQEDYQTVIKWDYRDSAGSLKDRDKNPLGFTVTYYQTSSVLPEN